MTDFDGKLFQRAGDYGQSGKEIGVTVALDNLIGDQRRLKPSLSTNVGPTFGEICANVPTAPEIWPTQISSVALASLLRLRAISWCQSANFKPNVIGSACTP